MATQKNNICFGEDKRPMISDSRLNEIFINSDDGSLWMKKDVNSVYEQIMLGGLGMANAHGGFLYSGGTLNIHRAYRVSITREDVGIFKCTFKANNKPNEGNYTVVTTARIDDDTGANPIELKHAFAYEKTTDYFFIGVVDSTGHYTDDFAGADFAVYNANSITQHDDFWDI